MTVDGSLTHRGGGVWPEERQYYLRDYCRESRPSKEHHKGLTFIVVEDFPFPEQSIVE